MGLGTQCQFGGDTPQHVDRFDQIIMHQRVEAVGFYVAGLNFDFGVSANDVSEDGFSDFDFTSGGFHGVVPL